LKALRPSTARSYLHHWNAFATFINSEIGPISLNSLFPVHIAIYVSFLQSKGLSYSSIRGYVSAISFVLKLNCCSDVTTSLLVSKALVGVQKTTRPKPQLYPITKPLLYDLLESLNRLTLSPYEFLLFKAMILLAFYGCLRACEYLSSTSTAHLLQYKDVRIRKSEKSKHAVLFFRSFKFSKSSCTLKVPTSKSGHCPVMSLKRYLNIRGNEPGPLFITKGNSPIARNRFAKLLKKCVSNSGREPSDYNTHSLRIGRATQLAIDGYSEDTIKKTGRWSSNAFLKYIRPSSVILPS